MNLTKSVPGHLNQPKWLRRAGVFGFWFFLIKGLLWLVAPLLFYAFI